MNKDKVNLAIGNLLIKEKYKFVADGLVSEIVRDFLKEIEDEK